MNNSSTYLPIGKNRIRFLLPALFFAAPVIFVFTKNPSMALYDITLLFTLLFLSFFSLIYLRIGLERDYLVKLDDNGLYRKGIFGTRIYTWENIVDYKLSIVSTYNQNSIELLYNEFGKHTKKNVSLFGIDASQFATDFPVYFYKYSPTGKRYARSNLSDDDFSKSIPDLVQSSLNEGYILNDYVRIQLEIDTDNMEKANGLIYRFEKKYGDQATILDKFSSSDKITILILSQPTNLNIPDIEKAYEEILHICYESDCKLIDMQIESIESKNS